ncbi:MAG: iron complex outerrane recepter protein [Thermoanaerobaculia bacterium]|jgi:outer membrane receptor protein involved in Fe transport|nr:iron complex outerrane recepter protein [Thermoanaerobaculia bacterium]
MKTTLLCAVFSAACAASAIGQAAPQSVPPAASETIEVTATKIAEDVMLVPASVTVIDGDELRARNARDLQSALATVGGVSIAPGGDAGPASSVPEMWGLREFDAFLLVVDGVPWGGAFNPDTPALDLTDVDRIEVVRGSAPVMYGATSFVGVIHVIHRQAGSPGMARVSAGSYGSVSGAVSMPLSQSGTVRQSIIANAERKRFRDDNTGVDRLHALYRAASNAPASSSAWHFDADLTALRQDPNSPHPREGSALTSAVPVDANHNPGDAHLDQNRFQLAGGWDSKLAGSPWSTTVAFTHSSFDIVRGFLSEIEPVDPNAFGFSQDRTIRTSTSTRTSSAPFRRRFGWLPVSIISTATPTRKARPSNTSPRSAADEEIAAATRRRSKSSTRRTAATFPAFTPARSGPPRRGSLSISACV